MKDRPFLNKNFFVSKKFSKTGFEKIGQNLSINVNVRASLIISNGLDDELEKLPVLCAIISTSLGLG